MAAATVIKEEGNQTIQMYIDMRQVTVSEWVMLSPILVFCDSKEGYKKGGGGVGGSRSVVAENGGPEVAKCDIKSDFGGSKGAALGIRKAYQGQERQGGSGV